MTTTENMAKQYRISALYYNQYSAGAKFVQDEFGWMRAERFTDPEKELKKVTGGVGIADISHVEKVSVKGRVISNEIRNWYLNARSISTGTTLVAGIGDLKGILCCVLSSDEALLLLNPNMKAALLERQLKTTKLGVTDMTSVFAGISIMGPESRAVLMKLTELNVNERDFPNLAVAQAALHHVQTLVLRYDLGGLLAFQIYFERAFGEYMWRCVMHAVKDLEGAPIGKTALGLLGWNLG